MTVDIAKVRSFWRFIIFILLIGCIGTALFWIRSVLFYDAPMPDISQQEGRDTFVGLTQIVFFILLTPIMIVLMILGYPLWRIVVGRLARLQIAPWICFAGGSVAMALLAPIPFIIIMFLGGYGSIVDDIIEAIPLLALLSGVVFSASFAVSNIIYRSKS